MCEITDHMVPLLLWFLALMALGEEYEKMSVHVYFIFPTQNKHILRKEKKKDHFCFIFQQNAVLPRAFITLSQIK